MAHPTIHESEANDKIILHSARDLAGFKAAGSVNDRIATIINTLMSRLLLFNLFSSRVYFP